MGIRNQESGIRNQESGTRDIIVYGLRPGDIFGMIQDNSMNVGIVFSARAAACRPLSRLAGERASKGRERVPCQRRSRKHQGVGNEAPPLSRKREREKMGFIVKPTSV
jgi:hypothetical protein